MKISLDPHNSRMQAKSSMNMSLEDVIKANQAKEVGNNPNNRNLGIQGGNINRNNQQQQQQQNKPNFQQQQKKQPNFQQQQQQKKPQFQQQQQQHNRQSNFQPQRPWNNKQQNPVMNTMNQRAGPMSSGPAKLVLTNLHAGVTDADIHTLFVEFGEIKETSIHYDRNGKSIGSGHVSFNRYGDAVQGQRRYNGVTLDGRPMSIRIESLPSGNFNAGQPKTFNTNLPQANNQKALKRLQKGPQQPMAQKFPQQQQGFNQSVQKFSGPQQGGARWPQQQSGARWPQNVQMSYGVSNNYSMGFANPGYGLSMQGTGSSGGMGGMAQQGILDRLGDIPSVLDRLDGGVGLDAFNTSNDPVMPSVLTRLGDQLDSGVVGGGGFMGDTVAGRIGNMGNYGVAGRLGGMGNSGLMGDSPAVSRLGDMGGSGLMGNAPAVSRLGGMENSGLLGNSPAVSRLGGMGNSGLMGNAPAVSRLGGMGNSGLMGNSPTVSRLGGMGNSGLMGNSPAISRLGGMGGSSLMGNSPAVSRLGGMGGSGLMGNPPATSRLGGMGNSGLMGNYPAIGQFGGMGRSGVASRISGMGNSGAFNRRGGMGNSGVAGRISGGASVSQRVGTGGVVKPGVKGREWSFAIPGGRKATPNKQQQQVNQPKKPQVNQPKKTVDLVAQQNQQGGQKKGKKATPTAEELDAELDAYLREMSK